MVIGYHHFRKPPYIPKWETTWTGNGAASCIGTCFFWDFCWIILRFFSSRPISCPARWQIRWHELGKGYSITNLKSQRSFAAKRIHCAIVEFAWCCTSWHASPSPLLSTATWCRYVCFTKSESCSSIRIRHRLSFFNGAVGSPVHFQENLEGLSFFTIPCKILFVLGFHQVYSFDNNDDNVPPFSTMIARCRPSFAMTPQPKLSQTKAQSQMDQMGSWPHLKCSLVPFGGWSHKKEMR